MSKCELSLEAIKNDQHNFYHTKSYPFFKETEIDVPNF